MPQHRGFDLTPLETSTLLTGKDRWSMLMTEPATTTLSSKGQVVIPEEIRQRLGLKSGAQFVVVSDRDVVIFKVLEPPSLQEFAALSARARRAARQAGLKRTNVTAAVQRVRRKK
jgi:AbrB family looped-hinge helix DNA binding protein